MKASGTICIPNLHCYKSLLSSAESSTSVVLVACQEAVGNIVVYQFGKKTRSLKSTKVGSKLLVCIEGEVVETRLTHLAKMQLYKNTI